MHESVTRVETNLHLKWILKGIYYEYMYNLTNPKDKGMVLDGLYPCEECVHVFKAQGSI